MARRGSGAAERAAQEASDAARVLAQRGQEVRKETSEPAPNHELKVAAPKNRPHDMAMEEIVASREPKEPEVKEEPKPQVEEPKVEEPKAEEPKPEEPKAEVPEAPAEPKTVRVKVDGEEFEVPKEEVEEAGGIRSYQIQRASENRLRKATEALAEVRKAQAEMVKQQTPAKPSESLAQRIAAKADEIRFGTPEQMAAALQEILESSQTKVDPSSIIEQATNKIRHDSAVEQFDKEFQDLSTNPMLLRLVVSLRNERIGKLNGPVDWNSFYRTIGNEVRSVVGRPSQPTTTPVATGTPSQSSEKDARKASIVNLPTAAARAELPKDDNPGTPEEQRRAIINEMKKARGIPTG